MKKEYDQKVGSNDNVELMLKKEEKRREEMDGMYVRNLLTDHLHWCA